MKKTAIILIALLICIAMSSLGLGKVKTAVPKPSKSGVDTVASATPSYYCSFSESYLKSLPETGGYYSCLKGSSPYTFWWQDWYGVGLGYLLEQVAGLQAGTTGVRLLASDGAMLDITLDRATTANSQGLYAILAWEKGEPLITPKSTPATNPLHHEPPMEYDLATCGTNEGPFRLLLGQSPNTGPYNVADPPSGGTPNFNLSVRNVRAVEVEPLPAGVYAVDPTTIPEDKLVVYGNINPYYLESISPTSGVVGTEVTISGHGFGTSLGTSTVSFGGTPATVSTWSDTTITCPVPVGATGTVDVTVTTPKGTTNAQPFTVIPPPPTVSGIIPTSGPVGTQVTLTGTDFGTTQGTSYVSFGSVQATGYTWGDTSITCTVPAGVTGTVDVKVTTPQGTSSGVPFSVTLPAPTVTSVTPSQSVNYNTVNMKVTGTGFQPGATVRMVKGVTTINPTKIVVTGTLITCTFKLNYASLGKYDVIVKNPDAQEGKWAKQFAVTNLCGASAAISVVGLGLVMGLLSIGGLTRRRRHRKN